MDSQCSRTESPAFYVKDLTYFDGNVALCTLLVEQTAMYIAARIDDFVLYLNNDGRTILALVLHDAGCNELRRPCDTPGCLVRLAKSLLGAAVLCSTRSSADYDEEVMGLIETYMCDRYSSGVEC